MLRNLTAQVPKIAFLECRAFLNHRPSIQQRPFAPILSSRPYHRPMTCPSFLLLLLQSPSSMAETGGFEKESSEGSEDYDIRNNPEVVDGRKGSESRKVKVEKDGGEEGEKKSNDEGSEN